MKQDAEARQSAQACSQWLILMVRVKDRMKTQLLRTALIVFTVLVLLPISGQAVLAETPEPGPGTGDTPSSVATGLVETGEAMAETPAPAATGVLDEVVMTRTPEPTATPGVIEQRVTELAARAGLATTTFLGLPVSDWINLGISILWVLFGYLLGTWLIKGLLPRLVRRTATEFDDRLLKAVGNDIRWLVVLLLLHFSTTRLTFVGADLKTILLDAYFVLGLAIGFRIVWRLIGLGSTWYRERAARLEREEQFDPIITLLARLGQAFAGVVGISILLSHFGINVVAFAAVLGIGGLALSLAAKDVVADAIEGFIILVDQPFRMGDRIEIQEVDTWGDVIEIGLRTTRIRTRDNREVIVPNSIIGANQVINYSYPDPRYRIQTHVGIGYGADIHQLVGAELTGFIQSERTALDGDDASALELSQAGEHQANGALSDNANNITQFDLRPLDAVDDAGQGLGQRSVSKGNAVRNGQ